METAKKTEDPASEEVTEEPILSKRTFVDKIETVMVKNHYVLQVRERKAILEDGVEISSNFHRYVLDPGSDISGITDEKVLAQFNAIMTNEVKDEYQEFLKIKETEIK